MRSSARAEYAEELARLGLQPWRPRPKESLAFVNSNAFTLGWTALALHRVSALLDRFDEAAALTFEGMLGNVQALDPAVGEARPLPGSRETIARMQELLAGGVLLTGELHRHLQDPLTMRIVPQTHGAARTALAHAREIVEIELVSSHDNPAIAPDGRAISNGNFDSVPYGITLDYVRLALAHVLTASCERANKLVYSGFSGLPTGLREDDTASEDGLAITVYGANAAAAEARPAGTSDHARALDDEHRRGHRGQGHPDDARRAATRGDGPARELHRRRRADVRGPGGRSAQASPRSRRGHATRLRARARARPVLPRRGGADGRPRRARARPRRPAAEAGGAEGPAAPPAAIQGPPNAWGASSASAASMLCVSSTPMLFLPTAA